MKNDKQILRSIANELIGIAVADATTAERNIADQLIKAGIVCISSEHNDEPAYAWRIRASERVGL